MPAVWGSLEDADKLFQAVKSSGRRHMMFGTSCYHEDLYAMRQIYQAGGFGEIVYTEGEDFHCAPTPMASYKEWRTGSPPSGMSLTRAPTISASPAPASPRWRASAC